LAVKLLPCDHIFCTHKIKNFLAGSKRVKSLRVGTEESSERS